VLEDGPGNGKIHAMSSAIETTIDASGRLVLPKAVRAAAGLEPGMRLAITVSDGRIAIEPAPREVRMERRGRLMVAVPLAGGPALSSQAVRKTQTAVRRRR
jgi:AbrB family looped-hinge helix DNA binding protein